ncbi:MAG TPA: short-chain fatty acyl-CoA regulator family protein [Povalibacter sp.]|nr:short-chain fatty acyl-CoA regulator family protein [Povalibacter sp.]
MAKAFMGVRVQRLREQRGISQVNLAKALGISPSYLNQIERNQRPLTVPVLLRLSAHFGVDAQVFSDSDETQLITEVREVLADAGMESASLAEVRSLAMNMPGIGRAIVELHRRLRASSERSDTFAALLGDEHKLASFALPGTHDEVRDYLNQRSNHIVELDEAAERIFHESRLVVGDAAPRLAQHLQERHAVLVTNSPGRKLYPHKRVYDATTRTLQLPDYLRSGQQAFQMAVQLALLEMSEVLDQLIGTAGFTNHESEQLARIGLANYFAGALIMPYGPFLEAAEEMSYDIELLANHFGVGFEAVCHRLSTLQRPGRPGLPFFFVRVDRAGNVSKRHSAAEFHFSRVGGTCPLWIVYEAFSQSERVLTQIAGMPDGRNYFWVARQVVSGPVGYGRPHKTFAVGLGCDLRHAHRLIYSRGLDLSDPAATTPIGVGCRVCERQHCPQRAFAPLL